MQRFLIFSSSPPLLLLSLLFLSSFHSRLVSAQDITIPIDKSSFTSVLHGSFESSGTLTLDASGGDAQAFYVKPITLSDAAGTSVPSFSSFFTFASNASTGNGSIAYAFVQDVSGSAVSLTEARKTLTIEFNTSCSTGAYNVSGLPGGWGGFQGRGGGYWGGGGGGPGYGGFGGLGGFQVAEYANSTSVSAPAPGGYGPGWTNQPPEGPYFCSQQPPQTLPNPIFQYQVAVDYNASTQTLWVGSPSCGANIARTTQFNVQTLSGIVPRSVYVGFLVSGGAIFNITQWNFTANSNTNTALNLALSSTTSTATPGSPGGVRNSNGGLKKGYVIGFSVLGAGIGVAALFLVCCLCARRKREVTSARFVGKGVHRGTIPESAVVFDAKKPNAPPAKVVLVDRDTAPLNTHANSAFHGSTGAASWLQPVAPR